MNKYKKTFINILKKYTNIDKNFLDDIFSNFKLTNLDEESYDFNIYDIQVAKWLDIDIQTLRNRLRSKYTNKNNEDLYIENVDYIRIKDGKNVQYKITYLCFENLAMQSQTENGEMIRLYFSKIREFIQINQSIIYQALDHKTKLNKIVKEAKDNNKNFFYIIAIDDRYDDIVKIGHTKDIIKRLRNYNVGRIKDTDLKFLAIIENQKDVEDCMKINLEEYRYIKRREIYKINNDILEQILNKCKCENNHLCKMIEYLKNKVNIKPYIIID